VGAVRRGSPRGERDEGGKVISSQGTELLGKKEESCRDELTGGGGEGS